MKHPSSQLIDSIYICSMISGHFFHASAIWTFCSYSSVYEIYNYNYKYIYIWHDPIDPRWLWERHEVSGKRLFIIGYLQITYKLQMVDIQVNSVDLYKLPNKAHFPTCLHDHSKDFTRLLPPTPVRPCLLMWILVAIPLWMYGSYKSTIPSSSIFTV